MSHSLYVWRPVSVSAAVRMKQDSEIISSINPFDDQMMKFI